MSDEGGLYRSFDRWLRNLSRGKYAVSIGIVSAVSSYAFYPLYEYPEPDIGWCVLMGVGMAAVAYVLRPLQNSSR